jgi:hypothetical protein
MVSREGIEPSTRRLRDCDSRSRGRPIRPGDASGGGAVTYAPRAIRTAGEALGPRRGLRPGRALPHHVRLATIMTRRASELDVLDRAAVGQKRGRPNRMFRVAQQSRFRGGRSVRRLPYRPQRRSETIFTAATPGVAHSLVRRPVPQAFCRSGFGCRSPQRTQALLPSCRRIGTALSVYALRSLSRKTGHTAYEQGCR